MMRKERPVVRVPAAGTGGICDGVSTLSLCVGRRKRRPDASSSSSSSPAFVGCGRAVVVAGASRGVGGATRGARGSRARARARDADDEDDDVDAEDDEDDDDEDDARWSDDYDEDAEDDEDQDADDADEDEDEDEDSDAYGGAFGRSYYDEDDLYGRDADDDDDDDDEDEDDDDEFDYSTAGRGSEARGLGSFGDIDLIAEQEELDELERDVPLEESRHFTDAEGNLRGRALYICQLNWWLRVKNMQTYPPSNKEVAELAERTGVSFDAIVEWFDLQCETFVGMSLSDQAAYEAECAKRQKKLEELVAIDFQERSQTHFIEEDIFYDEADLMHEADMDEEPLTLAMERLDDALEEEAREDYEYEMGDAASNEGTEGLDESQLTRIYQDGSESNPFLIHPRKEQNEGAEIIHSSNRDDFGGEWLSDGGWDALPQHIAVSATDGASLNFVGIQNEEIRSGKKSWLRERDPITRSLVDAPEAEEEVDTDPIRHFGESSRIMHGDVEMDQQFEGVVVAMDLYHGAHVDIGTEIDALLPINESDWMTVRDHLSIGDKLTVKVTAKRDKWWRFRFPVEVMPTRQDLLLMIKRHPHAYGSPISIYAGETLEEACRDAGREVSEEDARQGRKQYTRDDIKKIIESTYSRDREITKYERDMLAAGVEDDDDGAMRFTQRIEARLGGEDDDDDDDDYDDEEENDLYSDGMLPLENEDVDDDDDDDDDALR